MKKGFLTIAYGDYYHELAENLVLSYRYSVPEEKQVPFAVVAEKESDRLGMFDEIIIAKPAEKGFMNKLMIEELSPYDETIFIDADCLVYGDISVFFNEYEKNGSVFSSFGRNIELNKVSEINNILFDKNKARKKWGYINFIPHFNAATYFCQSIGGAVCKTAQELYHSGIDYGYPFWGDEPYISLAMAIHNCKCTDFEGSVYFGSHTEIVMTDILENKFEAITYGRHTTAPLLHWSTMKTHHYLYVYEVARLKWKMGLIPDEPKEDLLPRLKKEWSKYYRKIKFDAYAEAVQMKLKKMIKIRG